MPDLITTDNIKRCSWCGDNPLYQHYHDHEWGRPNYDDRYLFEMLILEGAQAGLSWYTILKKREHYKRVFDNFDAEKIARYDDTKIAALLNDPGIVRNRLKIHAAIKNARAYLNIVEEHGNFHRYIWQFVDGQPQQNHWRTLAEMPANTTVSDTMSKNLKQVGFTFVGSTICYSFMQASGMVNDHLTDCHMHFHCKN